MCHTNLFCIIHFLNMVELYRLLFKLIHIIQLEAYCDATTDDNLF